MVSHGMAWLPQGLHRYYFTTIIFGLWISSMLCSEAAAETNGRELAKDVQVKVGDTVTLSCDPPESGDFRVFWKKGAQILSVDKAILINEPRLSLDNGYDLKIKDVVLKDEDMYECQVSTDPITQYFRNVIVTVPPKVEMSMARGPHYLMLGEFFQLICKATGKPKPTLTWKKSGKKFPSDQMPGSNLQIQSLSYEDGGQYECIANNGIGVPASASVDIEVHYEPKATIADDFIHTGPGRSLSVICSVESSPDADVTWTYDGMPMEDFPNRIKHRVTEEFPKTLHELRINPVTVDDLGQYECIARNKYGEESDSFNLTAVPHKVTITSKEISSYSQAYRIRWKVRSIPQLVSNKIKLRLINDTEPGPWQEINVPVNPGDKRGQADRYFLTFDITGLAPESVYEVMIQAENDFGYGEFSDLFTFQTPMNGNDTLPAPPPTTRKPVIADEPSTKQYVPFVMENGVERLGHLRFFLLALLLCLVAWFIL